jgi:hypothetical protein
MDPNTKHRPYRILTVMLAATFILWVSWPFLVAEKLRAWSFPDAAPSVERVTTTDKGVANATTNEAESNKQLAAAGQFGDVFGGINALFTAFAFAGLIWSGWLQRHELELQRKQLGQQGNELKRQADQIVESNRLQTEQRLQIEFLHCLDAVNQKQAGFSEFTYEINQTLLYLDDPDPLSGNTKPTFQKLAFRNACTSLGLVLDILLSIINQTEITAKTKQTFVLYLLASVKEDVLACSLFVSETRLLQSRLTEINSAGLEVLINPGLFAQLTKQAKKRK